MLPQRAPVLALVIALIAGCGGGASAEIPDGAVAPEREAGPGDAANPLPQANCRKQWTRRREGPAGNSGSTVKAGDGKLSLDVSVGLESWSVTAVSTRRLTGDFEVTVKVDNFPHQEPDSYLWIAVGEGSEGGALFGGSEAATGWRGVGWPHADSVTSETSATFKFQRFGAVLGIRAQPASETMLSTRNVQFTTEPVAVTITLRASHGISSAGATISEVTVSGGGGDLRTDTFDCDSVE
jgi:hypothetical protein